MKRIVNIILCLVILFSLVACKKDEKIEIEPPLPTSTIEKEEIKEDVARILFDATGHTPIVIPVINKV